MLLIFGYFLILIMGVTLGMLGGGGSILTVPILVYLFFVNPVTATAYSLFIVGVVAGLGFFKKWRMGEVDVRVGLLFSVPGFLGVLLDRILIVPWIPEVILETSFFTLNKDTFIMLLFAVLMLFASVSMIRGRKESQGAVKTKSALMLILQGFAVGLLTGLVGAGGGFIIIPALVYFAGLSMKKAVGTSLMIITINSLIGFLGDVMVSPNMDWLFLVTLVLIAGVGIHLGSGWSQKVPEKKLKIAFGYFVLVMGSVILGQQLFF